MTSERKRLCQYVILFLMFAILAFMGGEGRTKPGNAPAVIFDGAFIQSC